MITKLTNYGKWLKGSSPLPAGAIPLALDNGCELLCLMPTGCWIGWHGGAIKSKPPEISKEVTKVVISELGGVTKASEKLSTSKRTLEGWMQGRSLPMASAYELAKLLD